MTSRFAFGTFAVLLLSSASFGQTSAIPQLNSRPGAAYTVYLNFGGFNFTGTWGGGPTDLSPGSTPAYSVDANTATFNSTEIANMQTIWARTAEKYAVLNVNVTTVDPAPAGSTDSQRQAFYDSNARVMQTVVGGNGSWAGGGGVSYNGTTQSAWSTSGFNGGAGRGYHTNWVFAGLAPTSLQFVAEATAHEQGHGLNLRHQSRWVGGTFVTEYDTGTGTGPGSVAPIMGNSYSAERGLWRVGSTLANGSTTAQNDLAILRANSGMAATGAGGFIDSGVGHLTATATPLPMTGTTVNFNAAKGVITPNSATPNPIGEANYTSDYFAFTVAPGSLANATITLQSGNAILVPGLADEGATLNATLRLLDASGNLMAISNTSLFTEQVTANSLLPGTYYLQISSAGGFTDSNGYAYFDVGSYFLTGSIVPVPEPALVLVLASAAVSLTSLRRRYG